MLAFRYRNLPYALPLIPALALTAVEYAPRFKARWAWPALAVSAALLFIWLVPVDRWAAPPPIPEARALREYYERGRPQWLFNVAPADEFYSFALPGLRVRYVFVDPAGVVVKYAPHYAWLGITMTGAEFRKPRRGAWRIRAALEIVGPRFGPAAGDIHRPTVAGGRRGTRSQEPERRLRRPTGVGTVKRHRAPERSVFAGARLATRPRVRAASSPDASSEVLVNLFVTFLAKRRIRSYPRFRR